MQRNRNNYFESLMDIVIFAEQIFKFAFKNDNAGEEYCNLLANKFYRPFTDIFGNFKK